MLFNKKIIGLFVSVAFIFSACSSNVTNSRPRADAIKAAEYADDTSTETESFTINKLNDNNVSRFVDLPDKAEADTLIRFSVSLFPGHELHAVNLSDASGNPLTLSFTNGKYQFVMPGHNVSVAVITSLTDFIIRTTVPTGSSIEVINDDTDTPSARTIVADQMFTAKMGDVVKFKVNVSDTQKMLDNGTSDIVDVTKEGDILSFTMPDRPINLDITLKDLFRDITLVNSDHFTLTARVTARSEDPVTTAITGDRVDYSIEKINDPDNVWSFNTITVVNDSTAKVIETRKYPTQSSSSYFTMPASSVTITVVERRIDNYRGEIFVGTYGGNISSTTSTYAPKNTSIEITESGFFNWGSSTFEFTHTTDDTFLAPVDADNEGKIHFSPDGKYIFMGDFDRSEGYQWDYTYFYRKNATAGTLVGNIFNRVGGVKKSFLLSTMTFGFAEDPSETITVFVKDGVIHYDVKVEMISTHANYYTLGSTFVIRKADDSVIGAFNYHTACSATSNVVSISAVDRGVEYNEGVAFDGADGELIFDGYNRVTLDGEEGTYRYLFDSAYAVTIGEDTIEFDLDFENNTYSAHVGSMIIDGLSEFIGDNYSGVNVNYNNTQQTFEIDENGYYSERGTAIQRLTLDPDNPGFLKSTASATTRFAYYVHTEGTGEDEVKTAFLLKLNTDPYIFISGGSSVSHVAGTSFENRGFSLVTLSYGEDKTISILMDSAKNAVYWDVTITNPNFAVKDETFQVFTKDDVPVEIGRGVNTSTNTNANAYNKSMTFEYHGAEEGDYTDATDLTTTLSVDGYGLGTYDGNAGTYYMGNSNLVIFTATDSGDVTFITIDMEAGTFVTHADYIEAGFNPFTNGITYTGKYDTSSALASIIFQVVDDGAGGTKTQVKFLVTSSYGTDFEDCTIDMVARTITFTGRSHSGTKTYTLEFSADFFRITIMTDFGNSTTYNTAGAVVTRKVQ